MKNCFVAIALLASQAWAIAFTSAPANVVAGQTYVLTWTGAATSAPVTILLREGNPLNLQTVGTITTAGTGGSFTWTAPSTYPPGTDYALQISQGTDTNYFGPFSYTGGAAAVSSAVASVAPSSAASVAGSASAVASAVSVSAASSITPSAVPSYYSSVTGYKNSTLSTATLSPTNATTSKPATATVTPVSANSAVAIGSPLALVLGAVAAMLYLQ